VRRLLVILLLVASSVAVGRGAVPCDLLETQPACYVALRPGPTEDTLRITEIEGERTFASTGQLLLTTVLVDDRLDFGEWIDGAFDDQVRQVPRRTLFPDQDREQVAEQNAALMRSSQLEAKLAALRFLGTDLESISRGAEIASISEPSALTDSPLEVGDVIVAVDGVETVDTAAVADAIRAGTPGDLVELTYLRDGTRRSAEVELLENPDDPTLGYIGALLITDIELPLEIDIDAGAIGGPSAGMMFALSIIDLLGDEDLTAGAVVAGTGSITGDGRVGPIGGIQQKVIGATQRGDDEPPATVFLVPRGNFAEAQAAAVARSVLLVPVDTLDDAVAALRSLAAGSTPAEAIALGP
jgi:Lon-like protease